jgi:hypothetical protein
LFTLVLLLAFRLREPFFPSSFFGEVYNSALFFLFQVNPFEDFSEVYFNHVTTDEAVGFGEEPWNVKVGSGSTFS